MNYESWLRRHNLTHNKWHTWSDRHIFISQWIVFIFVHKVPSCQHLALKRQRRYKRNPFGCGSSSSLGVTHPLSSCHTPSPQWGLHSAPLVIGQQHCPEPRDSCLLWSAGKPMPAASWSDWGAGSPPSSSHCHAVIAQGWICFSIARQIQLTPQCRVEGCRSEVTSASITKLL